MSINTDELVELCTRIGCENEVAGRCKGCQTAGYCSHEHYLEDWQRHIGNQECNLSIAAVHAPVWTCESEVNETMVGGPQMWVPSNMIHVKVTEDGEHSHAVANELLVNHFDSVEGMAKFKADPALVRRVSVLPPGSSHRGEVVEMFIKTDTFEVTVSGIKPSERGYYIPFTTRRGYNVHLTRDDIDGTRKFAAVPSEGSIAVGLKTATQKAILFGSYMVPKTAPTKTGDAFVLRTREFFRMPKMVRIRAYDELTKMMANVVLEQDVAAIGNTDAASAMYNITFVEVYVPQSYTTGHDPSKSWTEVLVDEEEQRQTALNDAKIGAPVRCGGGDDYDNNESKAELVGAEEHDELRAELMDFADQLPVGAQAQNMVFDTHAIISAVNENQNATPAELADVFDPHEQLQMEEISSLVDRVKAWNARRRQRRADRKARKNGGAGGGGGDADYDSSSSVESQIIGSAFEFTAAANNMGGAAQLYHTTDAESLEEVVVLLDSLHDIKASIADGASPFATEVTRIQNLIQAHAENLRAHDCKEMEYDVIGTDVYAAINKADEIGALALRKRFNAAMRLRKDSKDLKNKTVPELLSMLEDQIAQIRDARASNQIAGDKLRFAGRIIDTIKDKSNSSRFAEFSQRFRSLVQAYTQLQDGTREVRRGKRKEARTEASRVRAADQDRRNYGPASSSPTATVSTPPPLTASGGNPPPPPSRDAEDDDISVGNDTESI